VAVAVEHNGYEIEFDEGDDVWSCRALDLTHKSLKTLRTKINQIDADARRLTNVALIKIETTSWWDNGDRVTAVMIDGDQVWCLGARWGGSRGNKPPERFKRKMETLALPTSANLQAIKEASELRTEASALNKRAGEIIAAIPRVSADDLRAVNDETRANLADATQNQNPPTQGGR
jgi:hypothetical protein